MPGYVTYTDWHADVVAKACACGPWQEGLADGRYAWDQSNITADPVVKEAWDRIVERDRGPSLRKVRHGWVVPSRLSIVLWLSVVC